MDTESEVAASELSYPHQARGKHDPHAAERADFFNQTPSQQSDYNFATSHTTKNQFDQGAFGLVLGNNNNSETNQQEADLFQRRLDQLLVGFRSETMQEFL